MRELLKKYGIYVLVALVAVSFAIYFLRQRANPLDGNTAYAFFVDENNLGHEVIRPVTDYPPVVDADGKTLVQAVKRSDDGGKTIYIAYLLKYAPEVQQTLNRTKQKSENIAPPPDMARLVDQGTLIRSPKPDSPWLPYTDPAAARLVHGGLDEKGQMSITIHPPR